MAKPTEFPEQNFVLKGGETDDDKPKVLDLPCHRTDALTISCWKLDKSEIEEIAKTGKVWLYIMGGGHPPVMIAGQSPFEGIHEPPDSNAVN